VQDQSAAIEKIRTHFKESDEVLSFDELDGLTVTAKTWWFNVRPSNTEPLLRLNVEADTSAQMEKIKSSVLAMMH
jgi:phosphomannomutase